MDRLKSTEEEAKTELSQLLRDIPEPTGEPDLSKVEAVISSVRQMLGAACLDVAWRLRWDDQVRKIKPRDPFQDESEETTMAMFELPRPGLVMALQAVASKRFLRDLDLLGDPVFVSERFDRGELMTCSAM